MATRLSVNMVSATGSVIDATRDAYFDVKVWAANGKTANISFIAASGSSAQITLQSVGSASSISIGHIDTVLSVISKGNFSNGLRVSGDPGAGAAGEISLSNVTPAANGSGTGTVKTAGSTNRNNTGWLKIYSGSSVKYIPYWDDNINY